MSRRLPPARARSATRSKPYRVVVAEAQSRRGGGQRSTGSANFWSGTVGRVALAMRIESRSPWITWIPSEAIKELTKMPFEMGIAHYDDPARTSSRTSTHCATGTRSARPTSSAGLRRGRRRRQGGRRRATCRGLHRRQRPQARPEGVELPQGQVPCHRERARRSAELGALHRPPAAGWACRRPGALRGKRLFQLASASAWTTAPARHLHRRHRERRAREGEPVPRHWIYVPSRSAGQKSGSIDFDAWYREVYGSKTPGARAIGRPSSRRPNPGSSVTVGFSDEERRQARARTLVEGDTLVREGTRAVTCS